LKSAACKTDEGEHVYDVNAVGAKNKKEHSEQEKHIVEYLPLSRR